MPCAKRCRRFAILADYACLTCSDPDNDLVADEILRRVGAVPQEIAQEVEYEIRNKIIQAERKNDMSRVKQILALLADPIISFTRSADGYEPEDDLAGVLFAEDAAWFATRRIVGRISNLEPGCIDAVDSACNFYNYYTERFEENPIPITFAQMRAILDAPYAYVVPVLKQTCEILVDSKPRKKLGLMNFIFDRYPEPLTRKRIEAVVDVGCAYTDKNVIVPKFEYINGDWVFKHRSLVKDCIVSKYSNITKIEPETEYLCEVIEEDSRFYYMNVIRLYERAVRIALYDTRENFINPTFNKFDIDSYQEHKVVRFPLTMLPKSYEGCSSVVISAEILFQVLAIFRGMDIVNINTNDSMNAIGFENERVDTKEPIIEVCVMPIFTGRRG